MDTNKIILYAGGNYCKDFFSNYLPIRSNVYIDIKDELTFRIFSCFIDGTNRDFYYLSDVDPRFKYKIVEDIKSADYILCKDTSWLDKQEEYELIATKDEYGLFKRIALSISD
jgi:hypothetical protein